MNDKLRLIFKRVLAALIDLLFFATVAKGVGFLWNYGNGETSLSLYVVFPLYNIVFCSQEFFYNKTIGKLLLGLRLEFQNDINMFWGQKLFKLLIRRAFDFIEIVFPFLFIIFILANKKNQKLGDYLAGITIKTSKF